MSHFTALIIGDNIDEQLAPYDENKEVDEYIRESVSEDEKKRFIEYYTKDHSNPELEGKSFEEIYAIHGEDWNNNQWRQDENGVWQEYSTYNPDSKWDWYSVGGRWTGFFKLKKGKTGETGEPGLQTSPAEEGTADILYKGDVDFEGMEEEARINAEKRYDEVMELFGDAPANLPWEHFLAQEGDDIDQKRKAYWEQPRCKKWEESKRSLGFYSSPDDFLISREEYVEQAMASAWVPYAVVYQGKWIGRGEMGYWGISHDDKPQSEWNKEVSALVKGLPDDTKLTLVDCHI